MTRALVMLSGLLGVLVFAEEVAPSGDPRGPQGNTIIIQQQQNQPAVPYRGVVIFNDDVFKAVGQEPSVPKTSKSIQTGYERMTGEEAKYNREQRGRWMKNCAPQKAQDPRSYRECYENQRDKELQALQESREAVERRQGEPLRNTQASPVTEAEEAANAFGRADIEAAPAAEND